MTMTQFANGIAGLAPDSRSPRRYELHAALDAVVGVAGLSMTYEFAATLERGLQANIAWFGDEAPEATPGAEKHMRWLREWRRKHHADYAAELLNKADAIASLIQP